MNCATGSKFKAAAGKRVDQAAANNRSAVAGCHRQHQSPARSPRPSRRRTARWTPGASPATMRCCRVKSPGRTARHGNQRTREERTQSVVRERCARSRDTARHGTARRDTARCSSRQFTEKIHAGAAQHKVERAEDSRWDEWRGVWLTSWVMCSANAMDFVAARACHAVRRRSTGNARCTAAAGGDLEGSATRGYKLNT